MTTFILRDAAILGRMADYIQAEMGPALAAGKPLQVDIAREKSKRTTQQNKRHWAILRQIEEQGHHIGLNYSDEIWHTYFCGLFIGKEELPDGSFTYISSTKTDTVEFAALDEQIIAHVSNAPYCFIITGPDLPGRP